MLNLVNKYSADATTESEEGVVAIEYVVIAGLVAIGVAITFGSTIWTTMRTTLNGLVD